MNISNHAEYTSALERANRLRSQGATADADPELAVLDAAIHAYEANRDPRRETPGRPASPSGGRELPDAYRKG